MRASIVFDLDGTLIDSVPDLAAAVNAMLAEEGVAVLDLGTVTSFVGNGLPRLVELVIAHCNLPSERHGELTKRTLDHYQQAPTAHTKIYPGVPDMLEALKAQGHALGICTNKPEAAALQVLDNLNLSRFFEIVVGGDTLPQRKPDPRPLHHAFNALGAGQPVYVGDSEVDAETAQRAQVPFLLFSEGYRKTPTDRIPHDHLYSDSRDLTALVEAMSAD